MITLRNTFSKLKKNYLLSHLEFKTDVLFSVMFSFFLKLGSEVLAGILNGVAQGCVDM